MNHITPRSLIRSVGSILLLSSLISCGILNSGDRRVEYKKSRIANALELPPDLNANLEDELIIPDSGDNTRYSDYARSQGSNSPESRKSNVLPEQASITLIRTDGQYALNVAQPVDKVWSQVRDFWLEAGFRLDMENPAIGVMETQWNENRGDIPQDIIRRTIGKVADGIWSTGTRDKFRMRLERGENNSSEVYITHRGVEEVVKGDSFAWQTRPSDPELEKEMLKRMMVYMGNTETIARREATDMSANKARAKLKDGYLLILNDYDFAWQRTAQALDRAGFTLLDKDRDNGLFFIRQLPDEKIDEDEGWLSGLAFWRSKETQKSEKLNVHLKASTEGTHLEILSADAENPVSTGLKNKVLGLLYKQLK